MTMIQTMLGKASTFYKQEKNCWRTRILSDKNKRFISCHNKTTKEIYKGTIWCPSVDTGFWLAEREGLMFITGNTESNVRTMVKAIKGGSKEEVGLYRRFWAGIFTKAMGLTVMANLLMAGFDEDDKDSQGAWQRFLRNYRMMWKQGKLRYLDVDITPLYRALGGKTKERKYFSIIGHFKDPIKFILHPIRSAHHKGSVIYKFFHEALAGVDWAGRRFTTGAELAGFDYGKGLYKTTRAGKYRKGDPKYGKLRGKTVAWTPGEKGPVSYKQLPSFMLNQIKGWQPIQIQALLGWLAGEMAGFDALTKGMGLMTSTTYGLEKETRPTPHKEIDAESFKSKLGGSTQGSAPSTQQKGFRKFLQ